MTVIVQHFRMHIVKFSGCSFGLEFWMQIELQHILIVMWYTFLDFDISKKSVASTAAKIKKNFLKTPQMYQELHFNLDQRIVTVFSEPTKFEKNIQNVPLYISYCMKNRIIQEWAVYTPLLQIKLYFQVNFR